MDALLFFVIGPLMILGGIITGKTKILMIGIFLFCLPFILVAGLFASIMGGLFGGDLIAQYRY